MAYGMGAADYFDCRMISLTELSYPDSSDAYDHQPNAISQKPSALLPSPLQSESQPLRPKIGELESKFGLRQISCGGGRELSWV